MQSDKTNTHPRPVAALRIAAALAASALGLAASLLATPARAQSYSFYQGGYAGGAFISGHFSGVDLDQDGWLFGYELTDFSLDFSGNYAVAAFHHGMQELSGIGYRIGDSVIAGDAERSYLSSSTYYPVFAPPSGDDRITQFGSFSWPFYDMPGVVAVYPDSVFSMSDELIQVSAVPEPQSWALMGAGLGLFAGVATRRRRGGCHGLPIVTPTRRPGPVAALQRWVEARRRAAAH